MQQVSKSSSKRSLPRLCASPGGCLHLVLDAHSELFSKHGGWTEDISLSGLLKAGRTGVLGDATSGQEMKAATLSKLARSEVGTGKQAAILFLSSSWTVLLAVDPWTLKTAGVVLAYLLHWIRRSFSPLDGFDFSTNAFHWVVSFLSPLPHCSHH